MVEEYNNSHSTATSIDKAPVLGRKRKSDSEHSEPSKQNRIENDSSSDSHNKQYIRVITINKEFKALVEVKKEGLSLEETISTRELRKINPGILIDFYESKIKFTMKN